jgi:AcrR family transcriptional regulator
MVRTRDEAARRRVLDSARDLVYQLGPRAVTVNDIAVSARVGRQTIYRWWPSKSAVIMDALIELTDPVPIDLPDSTYQAIRLQMHRVARMFASRNGDLIRELVADSQGDPKISDEFRSRWPGLVSQQSAVDRNGSGPAAQRAGRSTPGKRGKR